ncbi:flavoprotein [Romboutsia sp. 1001713B170131_170501_G6]|uniref:flavoprotein n=1 Tax=Romboutsia sp. 1001713B170131_170501_G6 TaxID=2787108 RepID=UPI0018AB04FF|nr:flavoprotein [Romboutsia sp. 1001713B170131_170501_G6]
MDFKNLENIINERVEKVFIDYIVEKVFEKLDNYNKKLLVVFTGASIGFEEAFKCIKKLQGNGFKLTIVLSNGALNVFNEDLIKEFFKVEKVIKEYDNENIINLVKENTIIIIPTLTVNTCSKIANGISDNIATNIISYSLISGKKVIASINGCCPDNKERISVFKDNMSNSYKDLLRNNIKKLKDYNIILTTSVNLEKKVIKVYKDNFSLNINNKDNDESDYICNKQNIECNEIALNKKIISKIDIYSLKNYKVIKINKDSIITPSAKDEALKYNINILKI